MGIDEDVIAGGPGTVPGPFGAPVPAGARRGRMGDVTGARLLLT